MKRLLFLFFFVLILPLSAQEQPTQRFCFIGCNRVDFNVDLSLNPSTANVEQLKNTFREVSRLDPKPTHLFFIGDLILGYTSWQSTVEQLRAWKALYFRTELPNSGVELVPVMGNHEALLSVQNKSTQAWTDYPNPPAVKAWQYVMKSLLKWRDGPTTEAPNDDSLIMDESDLSFTVKQGDILFICLNTDTFIDNVTTGDIPLHWLQTKLTEAEQDESVKHVFVMGHKPLVKPDMEAWIVREEEREPAIEMLTKATKVRAFLTSHYHFWDVRTMPGGVPQIIAGNGGSTLKGTFAEPGKGYYGYTIVDVFSNGDLSVESWGRPVPTPYDSMEPQPEATLREKVTIDSRGLSSSVESH